MPGLSSSSGGGSGAVRAGRAFVELSLRGGNTVLRSLDWLKGKFQAFGSTLIKSGAALGGVGALVVAAFKPAIDSLGELGKIGDTADAFGLTAEKASRLFGIMAAGGSDIRDATEGLVTFNQRIEDALSGTGEEAKKLFADLGRGPEAFAGGDSADRFYQLLDALRQVPGKAKQVQLLGKAVGEDTGKNLIPILSMTADQVRNLGDAFESSSADLKEAREATRAQAQATAYLGRVWREIGLAIAPVVKEIAERFVAVAKPVAEFVKNNRELVATIFRIATTAVAVGSVLVTLGTIITGTGAAVGLLGSSLGALAALAPLLKLVAGYILAIGAGPLLAIAAVSASVGGLAYQFRDELGKAAQRARDQIKGVFDDLSKVADQLQEAWGGVVAAVQSGDLKKAAEIALVTIELLWAQSTAAMAEKWNNFKRPLVDGWHQLTGGLSDIFGTIEELASKALNGLRAVGGALGSLFSVEGLRGLEQALFDFLDGLIPGLGTRIGIAVQSIRAAMAGVVSSLTPFVAPLVAPFAAAADLISKGWEGLSTNLAENIVNAVAWIDKTLYRMSTKADNAFNAVARTVLDTTLSIAEAINKLPGFNLTSQIEALNKLKEKVKGDVSDAAIEAKEKSIDATYKSLIDDIKAKIEVAKKARLAADATSKEDREKEVKKLEDEQARLIASAKAIRDLEGAAGAIAAGVNIPQIQAGAQRAALISGSQGSFTAANAAQRFGAEGLAKKQLKATEIVAANTAAGAKAVTDLAKALQLK